MLGVDFLDGGIEPNGGADIVVWAAIAIGLRRIDVDSGTYARRRWSVLTEDWARLMKMKPSSTAKDGDDVREVDSDIDMWGLTNGHPLLPGIEAQRGIRILILCLPSSCELGNSSCASCESAAMVL